MKIKNGADVGWETPILKTNVLRKKSNIHQMLQKSSIDESWTLQNRKML